MGEKEFAKMIESVMDKTIRKYVKDDDNSEEDFNHKVRMVRSYGKYYEEFAAEERERLAAKECGQNEENNVQGNDASTQIEENAQIDDEDIDDGLFQCPLCKSRLASDENDYPQPIFTQPGIKMILPDDQVVICRNNNMSFKEVFY